MSLQIVTLNGSSDGIRWGYGLRPSVCGLIRFRWCYDMLSDRLRVWKMDRTHTRDTEIHDAKLIDAARDLVCARIAEATAVAA